MWKDSLSVFRYYKKLAEGAMEQAANEQLFTAPDAEARGPVTIRGEPHSVMQAINRQVAHYAYHCGQMVFWRSIPGVTAGSR